MPRAKAITEQTAGLMGGTVTWSETLTRMPSASSWARRSGPGGDSGRPRVRLEPYYRPAFADANGVDKKQVRSEVMGDIRNLRNDVIHHRGIATAKNTGKCKILTKLSVGDMILLRPEDVRLLEGFDQVEIVPEPDA
jgi:hypothetical protein